MKQIKAKCCKALLLVSLASVFTGGALAVNAATDTTIDESLFAMYKGASVRTEGTAEHPNARGLRFKTYATEFKEDLLAVYPEDTYKYHWYSELRFKMWDGVSMNGDLVQYTSYESQVNANVWHEEGWNTVLLAIPDNAVAIDIAAQSFVEVKDKNGATVYALSTNTVQYSAAQTASWVLAYNAYNKTDANYQFLTNYVDQAYKAGEIQTINLPMSVFAVEVGKSDDIQANTYPLGYGITYKSDNESVATVDGNGRVTGISQGTANITLSIGTEIEKVCKVTVRANGNVPTSYTSWTKTDSAWVTGSLWPSKNDISAQMYPFYHVDVSASKITSNSGKGQVVDGKIKITSVPKTAHYILNSTYLDDVFASSAVKAVRIKLTGLTGYDINHFMLDYDNLSVDAIRYQKDGDAIWLQFNRTAYETWIKTRESESTPFSFRIQFHKEGTAISGSSSVAQPSVFYVEEISPVYDGITEDFEYGMPSYITTDASASLVKVTDRTMGRGEYALEATPTANTISVNVAKTYADKVFANNTALQFRVYTDKDLTSVTVNGSASNVQYKYNADGRYYVVRISNAYQGANLTVSISAGMVFGTAYLDAFTGTNTALGANMTKTSAYAQNDNGAPTFQTTKTFNFFAYNSLGDGYLDGADYAFDDVSLDTMLEIKEAGFDAIMPQTASQVLNNGVSNGRFNYKTVLDLAYQAGIKVLLTDHVLLQMSSGESAWQSCYDSARETSGVWKGAAVQGSTAYDKVASQLSYYINHPAFMGVLVKDEPHAWMMDGSLTAPDGKVAGTYGFTYKTIKRVALEKYGKDIYIHANLLPSANYDWYVNHTATASFPELTVKEYGEVVTGFDVSSYANNGTTNYIAEIGSQFYTDLNKYIDNVGTNGSTNGLKERDVWFAVMRARYGKYCELFLQVTGAPALMLDTYPVGCNSSEMSERYLLDIQTSAEVAAAYDVDLHIVAQTMTQVSNTAPESQRWLTVEDVRWINSTLLSYGVKNIVYFTYHVHDHDGSTAFDKNTSFIDENGEKTDIWYAMQEIMSQNKAFEKTYQSFAIQSTKVYYNTLSAYDVAYGRQAMDVNYDNNLYKQESVTFTALKNVNNHGDLTIISEFTARNGAYMYSVMNAVDGKYSQDVGAYAQTVLTFGAEYTHAIVWRNGVKTLVKLDASNSLEIENGAGEAVFVIPYKYINKNQSGFIVDGDDNGMFFPDLNGQSNIYVDLEEQDNGTFFPDLSK